MKQVLVMLTDEQFMPLSGSFLDDVVNALRDADIPALVVPADEDDEVQRDQIELSRVEGEIAKLEEYRNEIKARLIGR